MSKNSCVWTPGINKDLSGEPSALHSDLVNYTGERAIASGVWAATKVNGLIDKSNLELDQNGEPTLDSLSKVVPIREMAKELNQKTSLSVEKREIGAIDSNGKPIAHDSLNEVMTTINEFNESHPDLIAYPTEQNKKFLINVEYKDATNYQKAQEAAFQNDLNNRLLGIMRSLGFTATNDDRVSGIFDPMNAVETANGLIAVIRIAKGQRGEAAFPEEFSHFMIKGLQDHPLVQRILKAVNNEEVIRRVLGEEYEKYAKEYTENGRLDMDRMAEEAAGKLLQKYITQGTIEEQSAPQGLFERLWNFIKNLFNGNITEGDVDKAINDANNSTQKLASMIMDESILPYFDDIKFPSAKALYNLSDAVDKKAEILDKAIEVASKRIQLIQARAKNAKYKWEDIKALKKIQDSLEKKKYASGMVAFLQDTYKQLHSIERRLETLKENADSSHVDQLRTVAGLLRQVKEFTEGYSDIIDTMRRLPKMVENGEIDLDEDDAEDLAEKAREVDDIINALNGDYDDLRRKVVYNFLKLYWGEDWTWTLGKNKGKLMTLEAVMELAERDIGMWDRWVSAMSDSSDPMLALFDKAVKISKAKRDVVLEQVLAEIRGYHKEFIDAGGNPEFMYEKDENGVPTGMIISNIDFAKFRKERREFIQSLKDQDLKYWEKKLKIEEWDNKHTVKKIIDEESGRVETLPIAQKPGDPYYVDRLSKLTPIQRKYYDQMMKVKATLDNMLPARYTNTYNAVQIRNDLIEGMSKVGSPTAAVKLLMANMKDRFVRRTDDTEFGEQATGEDEEELREKEIMLDFNNQEVRKLPIYYTHRLEDMSRLSTDFTGSLLAYAGMAVDYGEMSKIVDLLELTRDFIHDRDIAQHSGNSKLVESYRVLRKNYKKTYTKKGGLIAERLDDYMDMVVYGRMKKDEGTFNIGKQEVDIAKSLDTLKAYTGVVGLGLNLFSGLSNVAMGKIQIFIEKVAGEYFGFKDAAKGLRDYYALLPQYLGEINSNNKSNKLALLIDKYDALEEFWNNLRAQGLYKGSLQRIMKNMSYAILNNMGEHYLHSRTMLAMLEAQKVKINGKETSLYNAYKVKPIKNKEGKIVSHELVLKRGTTDVEGGALWSEDIIEEYEEIINTPAKKRTTAQNERLEELLAIKDKTDSFNIDLKLSIGKVNQSMNGAFNESDKGAIHQYALGRLAMQFRQWMPAHYSRRFASAHHDFILNRDREGYYRTFGRFTLDLLKDLRHVKFQIGTQWKNLSTEEKKNMRRAFGELSVWGVLICLVSMMGHVKDKKGHWAEKLVLYNLKRMKMETEASIPWPSTFFQNVMTLLQSPAASINAVNNLGKLLEFQNMFHEIQSGRYKGWSEYERDAFTVLPYYGQINKVVDLKDENYMFNIFDK